MAGPDIRALSLRLTTRRPAAAVVAVAVALDTPVAVVLRATLLVAAVALDVLEVAVRRITAVVKRDV